MNKLINILTTVATIAMAAVPLSAVGTAAHAAEARIQIDDLNLSDPADAMRFQARVEMAAHRFCRADGPSLSSVNACRQAIRQEAMEKLPAEQRENLKVALDHKPIKTAWRLGF